MISIRFAVLALSCIHLSTSQFNPSILQDSRLEPKVDGTFGFMYRTEDGIQHAAKGNPDGVIQGRFTYTDPTGLKVNFNYNAGSRFTPGYTYNSGGVNGQPDEPEDDGQYHEDPSVYYKGTPSQANYAVPQSKYQTKLEPVPSTRPQYRPVDSYQQPISRRRQNDVYDEDLYTRPRPRY